MPLFQIKPGVFSLDLLAHKGPNPASYSARVHACASAGDFETAVNTVHDMELAFSSLQDSKGLEILSPCSSLWPLVLAIAQAGPGALDVVSKSIAWLWWLCYRRSCQIFRFRAVCLISLKSLEYCSLWHNQLSWVVLVLIWSIYCCLQACYKLAEIHGSGRAVSLAAIKCVLQGCANIWDVYCACQTFEAISSTFGLTPDIHSINALLDAFGKVKKVGRLSKHSWSPKCLAVVSN